MSFTPVNTSKFPQCFHACVEFGHQVDVILNKEARADSTFIGVCEAAVESSRLSYIRA